MLVAEHLPSAVRYIVAVVVGEHHPHQCEHEQCLYDEDHTQNRQAVVGDLAGVVTPQKDSPN